MSREINEWLSFMNIGVAIEKSLLKDNPERGTPLKDTLSLIAEEEPTPQSPSSVDNN